MIKFKNHESKTELILIPIVLFLGLIPVESLADECGTSPSLSVSIITETDQECAIESAQTFEAYKVVEGIVEQRPTNIFSKGDRVVLCVQLPFSGYVTIWDAAPNGQRELLYPNSISHPNGNKSVKIENNQKQCIGEVSSGYEIDVSPEEGTGKGQFYLLVTDREEMQLSESDFIVPSYGLSVSIKSEGEKVEDMGGYHDTWLQYNVVE